VTKQANSSPPNDKPVPPAPPPPPSWRRWLPPLGLALTLLLLLLPSLPTMQAESLSYTDFYGAVERGGVATVTITSEGVVTGERSDGTPFDTRVSLEDPETLRRLREQGVEVRLTGPQTSLLGVLVSFLPILLFLGVFLWLGQRAQAGVAGQLGGFGRSRARVVDTERPTTRFADVAGYAGVKREVTEVVDYLRSPERYARVGARGPRAPTRA